MKIRVDLNLFPSELLRGVIKSDFADRDEMEILYDSAQFMAIYKSYLPAPVDYFQLPAPAALEVNDEIKIISYDGYSFKSGYEGRAKQGTYTHTFNVVFKGRLLKFQLQLIFICKDYSNYCIDDVREILLSFAINNNLDYELLGKAAPENNPKYKSFASRSRAIIETHMKTNAFKQLLTDAYFL